MEGKQIMSIAVANRNSSHFILFVVTAAHCIITIFLTGLKILIQLVGQLN